jgi:zinc protease
MTKKLICIFLVIAYLFAVTIAQTQTTPPPPAKPRSVTFPKPVEQTLPNGLRVIIVELHDMPLVTASLIIKNGGEVDPLELAGVADLTANLLARGTTTRSATKIAEEIENLGGELEAAARWDSTSVSVGVMSDKIAPAMTILADVVRRPTFKSDEIERQRQQYLDTLTLSLDEPSSIARFVGAKVLYGDGLYGHPIQGTLESVKRISRPDILKMHHLFYRSDNAILVIGGDINPETGFTLAKRFFGDWAKPASHLPTTPTVKKSDSTTSGRVLVIDKANAGQASVFLVCRGINRKDPDYYRGIVTNSVLNGYSGRLNQEIRIKRGLSYGAGSSLEARKDIGPFVATAQTKNESGPEVAGLLVNEVARLSTLPPTESELTPRKAALIGEFSRNLETVNGLVSHISSLALYGLSLDEINHFIENVQLINSADVEKFARTRLDAKSSDIILVGNSQVFLPELQKRYGNVEVIPFSQLDLNTRLLRKKHEH